MKNDQTTCNAAILLEDNPVKLQRHSKNAPASILYWRDDLGQFVTRIDSKTGPGPPEMPLHPKTMPMSCNRPTLEIVLVELLSIMDDTSNPKPGQSELIGDRLNGDCELPFSKQVL